MVGPQRIPRTLKKKIKKFFFFSDKKYIKKKWQVRGNTFMEGTEGLNEA